jgi:hypothetical protein
MRPSLRLRRLGLLLLLGICLSASPSPGRIAQGRDLTTANPILFVTQIPIPDDFTTIGSVFGNHLASMSSVGRGGDLWIRYPDGALKNLTATAGFGQEGQQGANAIAVRDPAVRWDGSRALFSMVIGAPTRQYQVESYYWQIYEISGLGKDETPVITKVPNQPANFNNITPIYGTDDRILFTMDRPRNGERHLYPQLDEYEEAPTVTGLWSLDPQSGDLFILNHAPSGDFTPSIDSFGRVIFTQWDHLQRDQQADADVMEGEDYGTFNYSNESAGAQMLNDRSELFPEPRDSRKDLLAGTNLAGHSFNHFFPWTINEDGHDGEVLNHLGRHELLGYIPSALTDDSNLIEYYGQTERFNQNNLENFLQIKEDPTTPGRYYGVDAPEFSTHASGQILRLDAPPTLNADHISVVYVTHKDTRSYTDTPSADHSGLYRDPLPLADGQLLAVHTPETRAEHNEGTSTSPHSRYNFRIRFVEDRGDGVYAATSPLTAGISKTITYWTPDELLTYSGNLWELQPVEVRTRQKPPRRMTPLPPPEAQIFAEVGVDLAELQQFMRENNLALAVTRNVTTRDDMDRQQPFNLRVRNGVETIAASGKVYEVAYMQFFQADQLRGLNFGSDEPRAGRRVLAQYLHDPAALNANPRQDDDPVGSVEIAADGSMAAFVPARRAMTWQMIDDAGKGVVRERYWLTFQPGEVRVCASCHGLSEFDQKGNGHPQNPPEALRLLLENWKASQTPPPNRIYLPGLLK